jgi:tRNA(Glu) U13 pseudouridine synthase TruD
MVVPYGVDVVNCHDTIELIFGEYNHSEMNKELLRMFIDAAREYQSNNVVRLSHLTNFALDRAVDESVGHENDPNKDLNHEQFDRSKSILLFADAAIELALGGQEITKTHLESIAEMSAALNLEFLSMGFNPNHKGFSCNASILVGGDRCLEVFKKQLDVAQIREWAKEIAEEREETRLSARIDYIPKEVLPREALIHDRARNS